MQKHHLMKNKFFSPCLQFLFTPVHAEAVNTMVYEEIQ